MPFEQKIDLISGTRFDPQVLEDALDTATAERQQLRESVGRALIMPPGSEETPMVVADKILKAAAKAAQAAVAAGESRQGAENALTSVLGEKSACIAELGRLGTAQSMRIEKEGQKQWERVLAGNSALDAHLAQGLAGMQNAGDAQALRLEGVGANQVRLAAQQVGKAKVEADRAKTEADHAAEYANAARDLSLGQLPTASETFLGLVQHATKAEAEAGLNHHKAMTPLRTAQAIRKLQPVVVEMPTINGPDSTREGATESYVFTSRSVLPATRVAAFVYSIDLTGEAFRVPAVVGTDGSYSATVRIRFGGVLGDSNVLSVYAVDSLANQSPALSRTISVRLNAAPNTAGLTDDMPTFCVAGQSYTVHFSGAEDADGDPVSYALESLSTGLVVNPSTPVAANAPITFTLPDAASVGAFSWLALALRVRDDFGGETTKSYAVGGVGYVDTPSITSPVNGATGVFADAPIVVSPFSVHANVDTAGKLHVQAARDATFTDIVWEYNGVNATQVTPSLPLDTIIYLRARRFGNVLGPEKWSETGQIRTVAPSISEAHIDYPAPRATGLPLNPVVRIATPTTVAQTWDKVHCRVKQGDRVVYDSGEVGAINTFVTTGITGIESLYSVEVRVYGSLTGWSAWKSQTFTTLLVYLRPPALTLPADGADPTSLSIGVALPEFVGQSLTGGMTVRLAPTLAGLEQEQPTQLWKPEPSTSFAIPHCQYATSYYVAAWWAGSVTGIAKSIAERTVSTMPPYVHAPGVGGVREGELDVLPTHTLTLTPFTSVPTGYYTPHAEGSLRIMYKHAVSHALIHDSGWIADAPTYTPPVVLPIHSPMYVSVQRRGSHGVESAVSTSTQITFTTINAFVKAPVITSPANNTSNVAINPMLTLATPEVVGQSVANMEVQASTATNFSSIAWTSGEMSPVTSIKAQLTGLHTKYYVRARCKGSVTGWTDWGAVVGFTTMTQIAWTYTSNATFTPPVAGRYSVDVHGGYGGNYTLTLTIESQDNQVTHTGYGGTGGKAAKNIRLNTGAIPVTIAGNGSSSSASAIETWKYCPPPCSKGGVGGSGGTTSFGSYVSATGGGGGQVTHYSTCESGERGWCYGQASNGSNGNGIGGDANIPGGSTGPKCIINFIGE
ncbi:MAG: hypothetical protein RRY29_10670 [Desulfovibrionaceae bacterium]